MADAPAWLDAWAFAHRGLHDADAPENSMAAFRAAIARGFGIECDLRVSADGRAMVFHDADLERLTGGPGVTGEHTVGELTAMALTGSEERIPTLRDMLELVAGQVPVLLELKSDGRDSVHKLCRAVRRDLEGYAGDIAVMSFDPRIPAWFGERVPDLPRGLVVTEQNARTLTGAFRRRLAMRHSRPDFLAYDIRDLPSRFAVRSAKSGRPLLTWTVKTSAQLETALACGAAPILEGAGVAAWEEHP
ncbi:glycerophosphodiester phosphodiesterase family protein [Aurantiacibacter aquimixticola]|uniref:Glycerophosphodiester phosphodiesterase n=1 Tax=Aurantiacibacter aquimixticola TaxID=1958945 RepID=A0A419RV89_9SPHN|nr:glycerophosphodiester phosphodiesterase family protein [Aurantiacibacter aquimixticola]RJY09705.1 glycerophosphodiester phosphodiesterase [Aurantiacibacter aquimixticola]